MTTRFWPNLDWWQQQASQKLSVAYKVFFKIIALKILIETTLEWLNEYVVYQKVKKKKNYIYF